MPPTSCGRRAADGRFAYAPRVEIGALDNLRIVLDPAGQAGIAGAIVLLMFSIALGLRVADFVALASAPRLFAGGFVVQVIGLPFVTWLVLRIVDVPASVALGMLVVACCPGGAVSNFLTWLARGNVAFSVTLTAASSAAAALLTPVSIVFWSGLYPPTAGLMDDIAVSPLTFLAQTTVLLLVPLVAGMLVARRWPAFAAHIRRSAGRAGSLLLFGVIAWGTWQFFPYLRAALPLLVTIAVLHNALAFALGALAGFVLKAPGDVRRALTFEVGIQNSGLALVILLGQLQGLGGAAAIAGVWGIWHIVAGFIIVSGLRAVDRYRGVT